METTIDTAAVAAVESGKSPGPAHDALRRRVMEIAEIQLAERALYWDERTYLPETGITWRTRQRTELARQAHRLLAADATRAAIAAAEDELPGSLEATAVARQLASADAVGDEFAATFTEATARCRAAWHAARIADDFSIWAPELASMLALSREQAEMFGYATERYDALLGIWEPGATASEIEGLFADLAVIRPLIGQQEPADAAFLAREFPVTAKPAFEQELLSRIGFDFNRGRMDYSPRAFCIQLGPDDVRLTTRFHGDGRITTLFSSIHEAGHGIYAQSFGRLGVPVTLAGAPGLGMDEAQSRMYENIVCRSYGFWEHNFEVLTRHFPDVVTASDLDTFHHAVTTVRPGSIRVGSDELTYNSHIQLRFELERAMINGDMEVRDLPEAWNSRAEELLGTAPESDQVGCLQDVHWSIGQWGYFPTYMLGNVYGAQLYAAACREHDDIPAALAMGEYGDLRRWFDQHVYRYGSAVPGPELVRRASGAAVSADALIEYLQRRYG